MRNSDKKPIIVLSAERFFQGGSVVIVNECLKQLALYFSDAYCIKALIFQKVLYEEIEGIEFVEFPWARKHIFLRLYYEYFLFYHYSRKWRPVLWLSMQDSTPRVKAQTRAVYFHNPLLLADKRAKRTYFRQWRLLFLYLLYRYIYIRNISKNDFVLVQQQQIAKFLTHRFSVGEKKVLLFPPILEAMVSKNRAQRKMPVYTFLFAAVAFAYKNFEVIVQAVKIIEKKEPPDFRVLLTLDGTENGFARSLKRRCTSERIFFVGFKKREALFDLYEEMDCLIFPSLLETWGLPLTEAAQLKKPIICADLPYSRETLANYPRAKFFDPGNAEELATYMIDAMKNTLIFDENQFQCPQESIRSWRELFCRLLPDED